MNLRLFPIALLAIVLAACNTHNHDNDTDHDHEHEGEHLEGEPHEHEKELYATYSLSYELFAEADVFVVGEPANILSHFSKLPSFKPIESLPVTAILSVNGNEVRQKLDAPIRKGIYSFDVTPVTAGTGTLKFLIDTAVIAVDQVRVYANHEQAHDAADHEESSMVNKVVFTKEQSWKIDFKTQEVKKQPFGQIIKTVAKIEPDITNEKVMVAKAAGIVLFTDNNLLQGKEVGAGQTLFTITPGGLSENNIAVKIREAKNNFEKAEADYLRKKELVADKIVSEKDFLEAKTTYENSKAVYQNLIANFNEGGQNVTCAISGFVEQVFVTNGQYVEAGQPMISVTQNRSLVLKAYVQQQYSGLLSGIFSANIKTLYDNQSYSFEELNGKILSFGKSVSDDSFLIPVNLQIDNTAGFVQGSLVEVYLKTRTNAQALTVPNTALLEEQGNYFVYVQETPELFEKRLVKTGVTDGVGTEIVSGLTEGERIVSTGAMFIKLAQASGALDPHSGHVH